jgi:hypothetical protein
MNIGSRFTAEPFLYAALGLDSCLHLAQLDARIEEASAYRSWNHVIDKNRSNHVGAGSSKKSSTFSGPAQSEFSSILLKALRIGADFPRERTRDAHSCAEWRRNGWRFLSNGCTGKLAFGATLRVPATAGYGVTLRSCNLQPADDRLLSPPRLMALRRFEPDLVDPASRRRGSFIARVVPEPSSRRAIFLRARFRPEDGESGHGRLYQQSAVWSASAADWRRHPAALLAMADAELDARPDLVTEDEATRAQRRAGALPRSPYRSEDVWSARDALGA